MNRPDFIATRFGAVICAAILDDYRSGRARNVTVAPALPALPAIIGHGRPGLVAPVRPDEMRVM